MSDQRTVTWRGSKDLEPLLFAISELEPFPGNPRRGNVAAIADSLNRFGQTKPVVRDGARIVAGHHLVQAAQLLEWTHVAAVDHHFGNEDEQRAFMLADNRTSDVGDYDVGLLLEQLAALSETSELAGTGYGDEDMADLQRYFDAQRAAFDPTLDPDIDSRQVTDEEIEHAKRLLDKAGVQRALKQVACPACTFEFFLDASEGT